MSLSIKSTVLGKIIFNTIFDVRRMFYLEMQVNGANSISGFLALQYVAKYAPTPLFLKIVHLLPNMTQKALRFSLKAVVHVFIVQSSLIAHPIYTAKCLGRKIEIES